MKPLENTSNNDNQDHSKSPLDDIDIAEKLKNLSDNLSNLNCELFQAYCHIRELEIDRDVWRSIAVDGLARSGNIKTETFNYIRDSMTTSKIYSRQTFERT